MAVRDDGAGIAVSRDGTELFRYVYQPDDPPLESPRPYLHPVHTLAGAVVTGCRPDDHPWHKGISWALANVGTENFWGGPTYRRGDGYVQLGNNGTMRHDEFDAAEARGDAVSVDERLTWVTAAGEALFAERRRITAAVLVPGGTTPRAPPSLRRPCWFRGGRPPRAPPPGLRRPCGRERGCWVS